jgi:hypothetical protein
MAFFIASNLSEVFTLMNIGKFKELQGQLLRAGGQLECVANVLKDISRHKGIDLDSYILKFEAMSRDVQVQARALATLLP